MNRTADLDGDFAESGEAPEGIVLAVVDGRLEWRPVLRAAARLARAQRSDWTLLYVETPGASEVEEREAAEALALATEIGGKAASVAAASKAEGVAAYAANTLVSHIVLASGIGRRRWFGGRHTLTDLLELDLNAALVALPSAPLDDRSGFRLGGGAAPHRLAHYGLAIASVLVTIPPVLLLRSLIGNQALSLLFLFPVLGIATRFGFLPALVSTLLSVLSFNFFVLRPFYSFDLTAPQNVLMLAVLVSLAAYAALLTRQLRERVALSDRSAQENAGLAEFGLGLTRAAGWEATAQIVCRQVGEMLRVRTAMFREVSGSLVLVAANGCEARLSPVDQAALDLAWRDGEETGSGTERLGAADWQFQPLKTSLGRLAVLGLQSEDGRNPVRADRKVLLSTMISQAALAHERLRLEDSAAERAAERSRKAAGQTGD